MTIRYCTLFALFSLLFCSPLHASSPSGEQADQTVGVSGIRVTGVGEHPEAGIAPARVQAIGEAALRDEAGALPGRFTFQQLQHAATQITAAYRDAGFLVASAVLPPQEIGPDGIVHIQVIEGTIGKVLVQGSRRYRDDQLAASSVGLIGRPLRQHELERAVLHARDLPGVSVSSLLRAGEHPGETDIVLMAQDSSRPYEIHAGVSNHGSDSIGRYRAEAGISAFNALGAGDTFTATVAYGLDPADSWQAAASLKLPATRVEGFSGIFGVSRSELELNSGPFALLEIHGPTTLAYAGAEWAFVRQVGLQARATTRWIHEESRLDGLGVELSRHKFDVLESGVSLQHTDRRFRGINVLQASIRKSINDESPALNWLYPAHESHFLVSRLSLARLQALPANQRVLLRGNAQFTSDALVPMEQFSIGGPDSVRAFPLSAALGDRGVQGTAEYQVDAPGFSERPSPFGGRNWGDVLTLSVFYDWGRVSPSRDSRQRGVQPITLEGAGVGLGLRLPWQPTLRLDLSIATPTGRTRPVDGDDVRAWARIGMTF